ncbi:hypothetical protein [Nocardioides sp.]|uniref:hypothetical protein n=1 Tax=Nocardioides sp. TaxID=35761 RepID=UPI00271DC6C5|nr:hypothetical protein [Nocardioides sp.]MDO9456577.1 hypothetical protein [Nocardioides sp.]
MSDQEWPTYDPGDGESGHESPWGREPTVTPSGGVPYGPPTAHDPQPLLVRPRRRRGSPAVVAGLVIGVALAVVLALVAFSTDDDPTASDPTASDPFGDTGDLGGVDDPAEPAVDVPPDVLSVEGYADLVAAVRDRTGSTRVFEAVLYLEYAVLDVPVDQSSLRKELLRWDGELGDLGTKGRATEQRIDLAAVDPALLVRLVRRAARLVEDPTASYVIIRGRSTVFDDDGARIYAYASNEFGETAYLATRLDGTLVRRYVG